MWYLIFTSRRYSLFPAITSLSPLCLSAPAPATPAVAANTMELCTPVINEKDKEQRMKESDGSDEGCLKF